jgi:hypothetical protein
MLDVVCGPQVSHLAGLIWALFQSEFSTINYIDYVSYASARWAEYKARKEAFISLEMP